MLAICRLRVGSCASSVLVHTCYQKGPAVKDHIDMCYCVKSQEGAVEERIQKAGGVSSRLVDAYRR